MVDTIPMMIPQNPSALRYIQPRAMEKENPVLRKNPGK